MSKVMKPLHPGEILREEFMEPLGLTKYRLAKDLKVSPNMIGGIVNETRGITPATALRLARYFGMTAAFWMRAQSQYDLEVATDELAKQIEKEVVPREEAIA